LRSASFSRYRQEPGGKPSREAGISRTRKLFLVPDATDRRHGLSKVTDFAMHCPSRESCQENRKMRWSKIRALDQVLSRW
jgi:hypothetical protein